MKEIKFRMWSKKANKYFYDPQNVYDCLKFSKMDETSILYEDLTWQQFTGEFDKNKKEIYEGDIVRVTSEEWGNENFVAEVIFSDASFLSKIDDNDIRGLWGGDDIEVVGNIFENNELLK